LLGEARAREAQANTQIESLGADLNLALAQLATEQKARADLEAAERARLERWTASRRASRLGPLPHQCRPGGGADQTMACDSCWLCGRGRAGE
jgi:hypothetical protein